MPLIRSPIAWYPRWHWRPSGRVPTISHRRQLAGTVGVSIFCVPWISWRNIIFRYRRPHRNQHSAANADTQSVGFIDFNFFPFIDFQAGLLVSAVRALATSATEEQRELERQRLLKGAQDTSKAIDTLVQNHQQELQVLYLHCVFDLWKARD